MTTPVKIGFVLLSNTDKPIPSTRISVLNMLPFLAKEGFETCMLFQSEDCAEQPDLSDLTQQAIQAGVNIVYFQKVRGGSALHAVEQLKNRGIKVVYGVCDLIDDEMAAAADLTIVISEYLRSLYEARLQPKIFVVHDGIEDPDNIVESYRPIQGSPRDRLNAVLITSSELSHLPVIGSPPNFIRAQVVGYYPSHSRLQDARRLYWKFRDRPGFAAKKAFAQDLLRRDFVTTPWSPHGARKALAAADIGIIPIEMKDDFLPGRQISWWQVKSENRLTLNMAVGLPVIAGPVPAYLDIIRQGENGFIAATRDEWLACFEILRDPDTRREIGMKARETVLRRYSMAEQARKLIAVLSRLTAIET